MFRFTIRDVLWLTTLVAMGAGWWLSLPATSISAKVSGSVQVAGKPVPAGRWCLHSPDGQIIGARVAQGKFQIDKVPVGRYLVTIDGDGVSSKYSDMNSPLTVEVKSGMNTFDFELR